MSTHTAFLHVNGIDYELQHKVTGPHGSDFQRTKEAIARVLADPTAVEVFPVRVNNASVDMSVLGRGVSTIGCYTVEPRSGRVHFVN